MSNISKSCHGNSISCKAQSVLFLAAILGAFSVASANETPIRDGEGISIKSESTVIENTPVTKRRPDDVLQTQHGTIKIPGSGGEANTSLSQTQSPLNAVLPENAAVPSVENTNAASAKNKSRPRLNPNVAGPSVKSTAVMVSASDERKHSLSKHGEVTKARHVKSVVAYSNSPELQERNEKLRKIKEHFRRQLENREERKVKKAGGPPPAEGAGKRN